MEALDALYKLFNNIDPKDLKNIFEGGIRYGIESSEHMIADDHTINDILENEFSAYEGKSLPAADVCNRIQAKVIAVIKK